MSIAADRQLLLDYLHGDLSTDAVAELHLRLASEPALAKSLQFASREESLLVEWARARRVAAAAKKKSRKPPVARGPLKVSADRLPSPTLSVGTEADNEPAASHFVAQLRHRAITVLTDRRLAWAVPVALVIVLLISGGLWWLLSPRAPQHLATVTRSEDARWATASSPSRLMKNETIALTAGLVEVRFSSGARVMLHGPARLQIAGANRGRLLQGTLSADVPPQATGFTIETTRGEIVDLGTQFALRVAADGTTDVEVFHGQVQAKFIDDAQPLALTSGNAVSYREDQRSPKNLPANQPAFATVREALKRKTIEATADHFVCGGENSGNVQENSDGPYMMIKRDRWRRLGVCRKAYIRFDLSDEQFDRDAPATFEFRHANNHLSGNPKSRFHGTVDCYALSPGYAPPPATLDIDWSESRLTWNNAPANKTTDASGLTSDAILLKTIEIEAGPGATPAGTAYSITLPKLGDYLQTDGTITIILTVQDQADFDPNLFIATHESTEFAGPMLTFTVAGRANQRQRE